MIDDKYRCHICGRTGVLQKHHCLHGIRRKAADKHDLTVWLCIDCHQKLHDHGEHDLELEKLAQKHFEETHSHAEYMEKFGKNYL